MRRLRDVRLLTALKSAPWAFQLLLLLALFEYVSKGLFLGLFSNTFDFASFYNPAVLVMSGEGAHVYGTFFSYVPGTSPVPMFFLYPAPVALMLAPLGLFSFQTASVLFQTLNRLRVGRAGPLEPRAARRGAPDGFSLPVLPGLYSSGGQADHRTDRAVRGGGVPNPRFLAGLCFAAAITQAVSALPRSTGFTPELAAPRLDGGVAGALFWVKVRVPWDVQAQYWSRVGSSQEFEAFTDNQSIAGFIPHSPAPVSPGLMDSAGRRAWRAAGGLVMAAYAWLVA